MTYISHTDKQYFDAIDLILQTGEEHSDRTGVGTKRIFGHTFKFDLEKEFPVITCKPAAFKNSIRELLFFLGGDSSFEALQAQGGTLSKWWLPWFKDGSLGPLYPKQWRNFNGQGVDQIKNVVDKLKTNKTSRRIAFTSFNPVEVDIPLIWPCHSCFNQLMVSNDNKLHMSTLSRSQDLGIGTPANWILYATLLHMFAKVSDLNVGTLTYFVNDLHIYSNHIEALKTMERQTYSSPALHLTPKDNIDEYTLDDFKLLNYKAGPKIKLPMAV